MDFSLALNLNDLSLFVHTVDHKGIAPAARHLHIPKSTLSKSLASGVLQRVLPAWTAGKVTTTLLMPHRRSQLPSVRAVADFLAARLAADSQV